MLKNNKMLFKKIDFQNSQTIQRLSINTTNHVSSWEHYYSSYCYAVRNIFKEELIKEYVFNPKSRGILFLLRHTSELCVKLNMEKQNLPTNNTHDFNILITALKSRITVPIEFENAVRVIDKDSTGECFRYYSNDQGEPFFKLPETIELTQFIIEYLKISQSTFYLENLFPSSAYGQNKIKWNLTLHLGEAFGLGHVKTEFDQTIEDILEGILDGSIDVNQIYLPLLSLIRNALEIGIKYNIESAKKIFASESQLAIEREHSLGKLFNKFGDTTGYLSRRNISDLHASIFKEHNKYIKEFKQLYNTVMLLDRNSYYFRFPVDTNGKPHKFQLSHDSLLKILKLYYSTNSFITFVNDVLLEEGIE